MNYRLFTFLAIFLFVADNISFAQSLEVASFVSAPNQYGGEFVKDINNQPCALIKVQIVDKKVSFEGDVRKFEEKGQNEWWVWIWEGAKYLTIKSDSFLPLKVNFAEYDIKLVGHQTYILRLVQSAINSDFSAKITVYGKDGKPLEGAKLTNRETGKSERTNSDGVGTIKFDKEGQTANIMVSHFRYSDTKDVVVHVGDNLRRTLFNYNPPTTPNKQKPPRISKFKPEKHTMEIGAIGGTNLGLSMDFTLSYFLLGFGVDWMVFAPEQTVTSALANSGYTGNFSKTTTTVFSGFRTNVFINMGLYFKYFSISCQGGFLCGTTVNRTSQYEGWGYGLVDGDLNEYWGSYEQRSFVNSTSDEELHFTLTPQIKGYIPIGKDKSISLSVGLGYTFIPSLDYYAGLSGSLGVHFRY